jgi:hypothetical protein
MLTVNITGLDELRNTLNNLSDRRFAAAIATALTRTAVEVRKDLQQQMSSDLDRPTPYARAGLYAVMARADKLESAVRVRDDRSTSNGTPPAYFLGPEVRGGQRQAKGFEVALQSIGVLPKGWLAVPAQGAPLDSYGNVSRAYIRQMIRAVAAQGMQGPSNRKGNTRRIASARSAGGLFFVVPVGGRTQPGIYIRDLIGRNITPVMIFVRSATYPKRFRFYEAAQESARRHIPEQITRSVREHIRKLEAKRT